MLIFFCVGNSEEALKMAAAGSDEHKDSCCKSTAHSIRWSPDNSVAIETITVESEKYMAKVAEKFSSLNKISSKFSHIGRKAHKNPKMSDYKTVVGKALKFLDGCSDFTSKEASEALENVMQLSEVEGKDSRKKVAEYLAKQNYSQVFVKAASGLQKWRQSSTAPVDQQWVYNVILLYTAFATFAYENPNLGRQFGSRGGAQVLLQDLQEIHQTLSDPSAEWANDIANATLGVLHSCFVSNAENREIYKSANAENILIDYSNVSNLNIKTTSLILLLYLTGDLNSDLLDGSANCVGHMTQFLKEAVDCKDHVAVAGCSRLSARELLQCLNLMATNDENREEIEKNGGVMTMNRMLQPDFSEEEQSAGAVGLWNLSRCQSGKFKTSDVKDVAVKSLKSLGKSANKALREASTFALWELEGRIRSKPAHRTEEAKVVEEPPKNTSCKSMKSKVPHVMISYQWGSQKRALEIRNRLVKEGYKVWMDVDKMKGNILTAMAEAVERAAVVVVCMTKKYKESLNCRSEASYAYKHAKPIVPILLEEGYKPDGWLGLFVGMQLYYELFSDDLMEKNIPALTRDIGRRGASTATEFDEISGSDEMKDGSPPSTQSQSRVNSDVQNWSKERVQEWFKENGLEDLCSILDFCDGKHLLDMYKRFKESPETFRNDLKSDLKLAFKTSVKFTTALETL